MHVEVPCVAESGAGYEESSPGSVVELALKRVGDVLQESYLAGLWHLEKVESVLSPVVSDDAIPGVFATSFEEA